VQWEQSVLLLGVRSSSGKSPCSLI
jgi:hypothetical protein